MRMPSGDTLSGIVLNRSLRSKAPLVELAISGRAGITEAATGRHPGYTAYTQATQTFPGDFIFPCSEQLDLIPLLNTRTILCEDQAGDEPSKR